MPVSHEEDVYIRDFYHQQYSTQYPIVFAVGYVLGLITALAIYYAVV